MWSFRLALFRRRLSGTLSYSYTKNCLKYTRLQLIVMYKHLGGRPWDWVLAATPNLRRFYQRLVEHAKTKEVLEGKSPMGVLAQYFI